MLKPLAVLAVAALAVSGARPPDPMPYAAAGLTREQAAAHLLSRFAYGARPGDVARVARDPEAWLDAQLAARAPEADLTRRLAAFPALAMSASEIAQTFPNLARVAAEARAAGAVRADTSAADREAYRAAVAAFGRERGYQPERDLGRQLVGQRVIRGVYAENQLQEVVAEFWTNHFSIAGQDGQARPHLLAYERDAVRPNALGRFRDLLGATARHPAMLLYLDNARSTAPDGASTLASAARPARRAARRPQRAAMPNPQASAPPRRARTRGVNENYARELMELHTLGVDGGYTQADVEAVARAFTGWTVQPVRRETGRGAGRGGTEPGLFVFNPASHDAGAKTVLGRTLPAGRGLEDGEDVLDLLASSPATARHLARKLAVRFVSDAPSDALVARLADVFTRSNGDTRAVVRAIAASPEFWSPEALAGKVKSPFELAASAVRATGADVADPRGIVQQVEAMGQALYRYPAPTGFPDRADHWLTAGTVAARVRFGLAVATGGVPGVRLDAARLAGGAATSEAALAALAPQVLPPTRPTDLGALARLAADPTLPGRIAAAAEPDEAMGSMMDAAPRRRDARRAGVRRADEARDTGPAAQALGVLLGSPAFQRR